MSQELIYGIHAVEMFLQQAPKRSEQLLILQGRDDKRVNDIVSLAKKAGVQIQHVTRQELEDKVDANHQGVILYCRPAQAKDEAFLMALIEKCVGKYPILGICLGHQALIQHYGGTMNGQVLRVFRFGGRTRALLH